MMRDPSGIGASARILVCALLFAAMPVGIAQEGAPDVATFFAAASIDAEIAGPARAELAARWRPSYAPLIVDLIDILQRTGFVDPRGFVQLAQLTRFLGEQTGESFGSDIAAWRRWVWSLSYEPYPAYGEFKGRLYSRLDPRFAEFFRPPVESTIRLDEIQWGGVGVNGIPPLDHPSLVPAAAATYLEPGNVVFGLVVNGEARAYPKRILAWHELALDRVGGHELTVVYCTLCGTVIPFESEVGGTVRRFGTSGLLYRSNKLMFDQSTMSLWSSLSGRPVVGPLAGTDLELEALPVVTTTWGEWLERHPDSMVLSLDTGFTRDYSEGAAYRSYFGTDELMFDVALRDGRLPNKAEVLVLRDTAGDSRPPLAIAADFLAERPVFHVDGYGRDLVVLTDSSGASRVYRSGPVRFARLDGEDVIDTDDRRWRIDEDALRATFDAGYRLPRESAHRAFWFGWYAQYPNTELID